MKNKKSILKKYSTALLTMGSFFAGMYDCQYFYVAGEVWIFIYWAVKVLIISLLVYLSWHIHEKFLDWPVYITLTTVVIPLLLGSFMSQILI